MGATARGWPYVEDTDAIGDFPALSLALATLLEAGNDELGYAQAVAALGITATTEATAQQIVALPSITFTGVDVVEFEFYAPAVTTAALAAAAIVLVLWDSVVANSIGRLGTVQTPAAASLVQPVCVKRRITPAAGARIISARAYRTVGNGSVGGGAGAVGNDMPTFLRARVV